MFCTTRPWLVGSSLTQMRVSWRSMRRRQCVSGLDIALLAYLAKRNKFPATLEDEDRALAALREHWVNLHKGRHWLKVE